MQVFNSGPPIPDEPREHLFGPSPQKRRRQSRRLGLGLFICAEIARVRGGCLTFTSDERDTRFRFDMKLSDPNGHNSLTESGPTTSTQAALTATTVACSVGQ
jgi:signal transduction histidine kinase